MTQPDAPPPRIIDGLRALKAAVVQAGGTMPMLHLGGAGMRTIIDELNVEQGRTIEPASPGQALPHDVDPSKVKFRESNVLFVEDCNILKVP